MSPLKEIRSLTPQEAEDQARAAQKRAEKEEGEMKKIEQILARDGRVALDFYKDHGGLGEQPHVFEQFAEMRERILTHFRKFPPTPKTDLDFDWKIESDKGTLIVKVRGLK